MIGSIIPANDVGMAMTYLGPSTAEKQAAALIAFIVMMAIGYRLAGQFIRLIATSAESATGSARLWFIFRSATLPALFSVLLLIPFREPRNLIEVLLLPMIVMISGMLWIQIGAWFAQPAMQAERAKSSVAIPSGALLILLAVFQIVLRPGIRFY